MNLGLSLDWTRCPDGVEIFERFIEKEEVWSLGMARGLQENEISYRRTIGKCVRFKSEAREVNRFESTNYRDSLVLKFASANTEEKLQRFLSDYGKPRGGGVAPEGRPYVEPVEPVETNPQIIEYLASLPEGTVLEEIQLDQVKIRKLIQSKSTSNFADQFAASVVIRMQPPKSGQQQGLLLRPTSLFEFMKFEAALIVCGHVEVTTCPHCGNFFVIGGEKAKRTDTKYCSPRCRVAAHRLRKKTATKQRSKRTK